jgi:membrane protein implicated in regulation of membrane protease activity
MSHTESIIGHLLVQAVRDHYCRRPPRKFSAALLSCLSALLFLAGIAVLLVAGYEALDAVMPHPQALAATGAALLLFSCLAGFSVLLLARAGRNDKRPDEQEIVRTVDELIGILGSNVEKSVQDNPRVALIAAVLAGLIIARKLH